MSPNKQARFSVSIPYQLDGNKLSIQPVAWPDQCPCCAEKDGPALGKYKFKHSARFSQTTTGNRTTTTSYPLEWEVPYCPQCIKHMKMAENWKYGIIAACIFLPIILALIIDSSSSTLILLLYALFILGGLALYRIMLATVVKANQKPACLDHGLAFRASSPATNDHTIVFNFKNDEYAQAFAALNKAEMKNDKG